MPAVAFRRHWSAVETVARGDVLDDDVGAHLNCCDRRSRYRLHLSAPTFEGYLAASLTRRRLLFVGGVVAPGYRAGRIV